MVLMSGIFSLKKWLENITLSAHYVRVYVEWFAASLERTKGGRETCSMSTLASYMLGKRIALKV